MPILENLRSGLTTLSSEETIDIGASLASELPENAILTLEGDLGAGKTTFVKGLAQGLCILETITSPTFNIFNYYRSRDGQTTLLHMDAYRLEGAPNMAEELMLEDFMKPPFCLAIEWPQLLGALPWKPTLELVFSIESPGKHSIRAI
jgi:tRNA threonylcarbamoyladenosine biosynthesis protein TsaE